MIAKKERKLLKILVDGKLEKLVMINLLTLKNDQICWEIKTKNGNGKEKLYVTQEKITEAYQNKHPGKRIELRLY